MMISTQRVSHALKTGLAIFIGALFYRFLGLENGQWILITIIVVMSSQINVGSLMQKALMRLAGTVAGAAVAFLAIRLFSGTPNEFLAVAILSAIGFAYLAGSSGNLSYVGTLGGTTVMIILMGTHVTEALALDRVFEIVMGVLISMSVSMLVFPVRAGQILEDNFATIFKLLSNLYEATFSADALTPENRIYSDIENTVRKAFASHERLLSEARREPGKSRLPEEVIFSLEQSMRKIFRGIMQMHHIFLMLDHAETRFFSTPDVLAFHAEISGALNHISVSLKKRHYTPTTVFQNFPQEMPIIEKDCTEEEKKIVHAFLIATQQVTQNIKTCGKMLQKSNIL